MPRVPRLTVRLRLWPSLRSDPEYCGLVLTTEMCGSLRTTADSGPISPRDSRECPKRPGSVASSHRTSIRRLFMSRSTITARMIFDRTSMSRMISVRRFTRSPTIFPAADRTSFTSFERIPRIATFFSSEPTSVHTSQPIAARAGSVS